MESPPKISHDSFTFRFPARLWRIINSCSTGAISWGPSGKTIRIMRKKFEEEYLTGDAKPFKTTKYESFVRQLNHYGFKKVKKRSAMKKITTPITHGESSKEETSMLSEYHNPNFTRGQPEKVTFLERRSQLHDSRGERKRNKRGISAAAVESQDYSGAASIIKKMKKETSVQVSQSLLPSGADDGQSSSDNENGSTSAGLRVKLEKARAVPTQNLAASSTEHRAPIRHRTPTLYQPLPGHKGIHHMYQHPELEGRTLRAEERLRYQQRPFYSHDGLESRYVRPSFAPPFSRHMSPTWRQPFHPCHPAQLYDHYFGACGSREQPLYPPFPPDFTRLMRVRSPAETEQYPPLPYPDNRYIPIGPADAWESVYRMNRRHGVLVAGDFENEYKGRNIVGKRMRWPQKHSVSSYEHDLVSHHDRHLVEPDPYSTWPRHRFNSLESMSGVQWRSPDFAANSCSVPPANNGSRSLMVAKGYETAHVFHNTFGQSVTRQVNTCTYGQTSTLVEPTEACKTSVKTTEKSAVSVAVQQVRKDVSNDSGLNHEQTEELAAAGSKSEDSHVYSDNLHIITDDAVDLPLDVAEETVITCNAASTATSDHCLPLAQTSTAEEKILIDTLMNTSASFSSENTPESFHLPTENTTSSSGQPYGQGMDIYTNCQSDVTHSQTFSQQFADHFNSSQEESPKPYTPVPAWTYSEPRQQSASNGHCSVQDLSPHSWPLPASKPEEETARLESKTNVNNHMPLAFTGSEAADTENSPYQRNHVYALSDPADNDMDCPKTSPQADNGHQRAKVLVQREERGELSQLSSTSVQELLSAALRTPGMKIMVDDNCHPENMVLVIPKGKRREINGCV